MPGRRQAARGEAEGGSRPGTTQEERQRTADRQEEVRARGERIEERRGEEAAERKGGERWKED